MLHSSRPHRRTCRSCLLHTEEQQAHCHGSVVTPPAFRDPIAPATTQCSSGLCSSMGHVLQALCRPVCMPPPAQAALRSRMLPAPLPQPTLQAHPATASRPCGCTLPVTPPLAHMPFLHRHHHTTQIPCTLSNAHLHACLSAYPAHHASLQCKRQYPSRLQIAPR